MRPSTNTPRASTDTPHTPTDTLHASTDTPRTFMDALHAFTDALHAEWTKWRTVPGWVLAIAAAGVSVLGFALAPGMQGTCGASGTPSSCDGTIGPDGEQVTDSFTFLHQPLTGDGSVTVRVASLTSKPAVNWSKAGLLLESGTKQGSAYAAIMLTGGHGVRWQYDYTHDVAGPSGSGPVWLRLTRAGDVVTGLSSADGSHWTVVGHTQVAGTVEAGPFVTSPQYFASVQQGLLTGVDGEPSTATGTFDRLTGSAAGWQPDVIGAPSGPAARGGQGATRTGTGWRLIGTGDIAPSVAGAAGIGVTADQTLIGTFAALIAVAVAGALFMTAEYRSGMLRTSFAAVPGRTRVLAAKAVVLAGVTFVTVLVTAAVAVVAGQRVLRANGVYVHPVTLTTEVRIIAGTAVLAAAAAILALGIGVLVRRAVTAVTAAIVLIVLPYLLGISILQGPAAAWMLRVTPAAAFAVQQTAKVYPQVDNLYTPNAGFYPLPAWAGLAVLLAWAAAAFTAAAYLLRRRDA